MWSVCYRECSEIAVGLGNLLKNNNDAPKLTADPVKASKERDSAGSATSNKNSNSGGNNGRATDRGPIRANTKLSEVASSVDREPAADSASSTSRLLSTALASSRFGNEGNKSSKRGYDESQQNLYQDKRQRYDRSESQHNQHNQPPGRGGRSSQQGPSIRRNPQQQPPPTDQAQNDPIKYFEEMNRIAVQSGFKNAQEMLASQKEMMAIMSGAAPPTISNFGAGPMMPLQPPYMMPQYPPMYAAGPQAFGGYNDYAYPAGGR